MWEKLIQPSPTDDTCKLRLGVLICIDIFSARLSIVPVTEQPAHYIGIMGESLAASRDRAPTDTQDAVTLLWQAYDLGYTFLIRLRCTVPRRTRIAASGWQGRLWPLNGMEMSEVFGGAKRTVQ